jgi:hypothetical protein
VKKNQPANKPNEMASPALTIKNPAPPTSWTFSVKFRDNITVQFRLSFGPGVIPRPVSPIMELKQQIENLKGYKCQAEELSFNTTPLSYLKNGRSPESLILRLTSSKETPYLANKNTLRESGVVSNSLIYIRTWGDV